MFGCLFAADCVFTLHCVTHYSEPSPSLSHFVVCKPVTHRPGIVDDSRDFLIPSRHSFSFVTILCGSSENNSQRITHDGSGACVTEPMSVFTDPATYGILNSELTNCPRTAAVLGELAAHWQ